MRMKVEVNLDDVTPSLESILKSQGIPAGTEVETRVMDLAKKALGIFTELAEPVGIIYSVAREEFKDIYNGIGLNDDPCPIENIYKKSHHLALFAATVGKAIGERVSRLFAEGNFALGNFLDASASKGTDLISKVLEKRYKAELIRIGKATKSISVLAYSPGYCGWHISSQKQLFEVLEPEAIGITLRDSFLMEPLKSISGVLIAGPESIHVFEATYPACVDCKSPSCQGRIEAQNKETDQ